MVHTILALSRMIKIEHSVFALPFAYCGAFAAAGGWPGSWEMLWLTVAMVAVRSFAMTVNRVADRRFDSANSRTRERHLVTGEISLWQAWCFLLGMAFLFVGACALLGSTCLMLSPLALLCAAGYSFMKRFTWLCHFGLGVVLALAPLAGWLSVQGELGLPAWLLFWAVVFWVAGFDILYASQDTAFDREVGLHSVPARFGLPTGLVISSFCHVNTALLLWLFGYAAELSFLWYPVWLLVSAILLWEHTLISAEDMSKVNAAFFTLNGVVSILVFVGVLVSL